MKNQLSIFQTCSRGNALLDTLLFLPLGLLFLFALVDAGTAFLEQASIRDSVRSLLASEAYLARDLELILADSGEVKVNPVAAGEVLDKLETEIREVISDALRKESWVDVEAVAVDLRIYSVQPNEDETVNRRLLSIRESPPGGIAQITALAAEESFISADDYLNHRLSSPQAVAKSGASVKLGISYDPELQTGREDNLGEVPMLYVDVRGISQGLGIGITKSLLGKFYSFQEQTIQVPRKKL